MNNIIPFNYHDKEIRIITDENGDPWWVAKDICAIPGLSSTTEAIKILDNSPGRSRSLSLRIRVLY